MLKKEEVLKNKKQGKKGNIKQVKIVISKVNIGTVIAQY